jgi:hypothetical protein
MSPKDKTASIRCPIQRVLARRVGDCLDTWSLRFAELEPAERLLAHSTAENDAERWRNLSRMPALGMVARLARDLGLANNDLHAIEPRHQPSGRVSPPGRAEVPELTGVQRTTVLSAMRLWDALAEDRSDVGVAASQRYAVILTRAQDDLAKAKRGQCDCPACEARWPTVVPEARPRVRAKK